MMDKIRQIEKMADILCESKNHVCNGGDDCLCVKQASDLYDNGCRLNMDESKKQNIRLLLSDAINWLDEIPSSVAKVEVERDIRRVFDILREDDKTSN